MRVGDFFTSKQLALGLGVSSLSEAVARLEHEKYYAVTGDIPGNVQTSNC